MFWKYVANGYITAAGTGVGQTDIPEADYKIIKDLFNNQPEAPEGFDYRLKESLEWELYELPPDELPPVPPEEPSYEELAEAYNTLVGGE